MLVAAELTLCASVKLRHQQAYQVIRLLSLDSGSDGSKIVVWHFSPIDGQISGPVRKDITREGVEHLRMLTNQGRHTYGTNTS